MDLIQNNHPVDEAYAYEEKNGHIVKRTLSAIYYKGRLIWELIVGYIFTHDGFSLKSKDGFVLKCKDQ